MRLLMEVKFKPAMTQIVNLGMIVSAALMIWKGLICVMGCQSPFMVVLTGSMEPGFKRGDLLFFNMNKEPIRAGEIVVFDVDGRDIPIVHRVIEVHERQDKREIDILTKGDNNSVDDRAGAIYSEDQLWVNNRHMIGRAKGYLPYVGYLTIIITEKPVIKYVLIGALGLLVIMSNE